jgi:hypothetical protein
MRYATTSEGTISVVVVAVGAVVEGAWVVSVVDGGWVVAVVVVPDDVHPVIASAIAVTSHPLNTLMGSQLCALGMSCIWDRPSP